MNFFSLFLIMKNISFFFFFFFISLSLLKAQQPVQSENSSVPAAKHSYLGVGVGLPYGWYGFNLETPLYRQLYISGGAGPILHKGNILSTGFSIGPALYLRQGTANAWQPKFLALYGTNGYAVHYTKQIYTGVTLGFSNNFMFGQEKKHGFTIDLLYIASSGFYKEHEDENGRFKIGFAYKYLLRHQ